MACCHVAATQPPDRPKFADGSGPTIWDGIYTVEQAERGAAIYPAPCGRCHGARLNGAPDDPDMLPATPISGRVFLREWDGRSLAALLRYMKSTMPSNNPGFLSDREYIDLLAYMLSMSAAPAGDAPLPDDASDLAQFLITPKTAAAQR